MVAKNTMLSAFAKLKRESRGLTPDGFQKAKTYHENRAMRAAMACGNDALARHMAGCKFGYTCWNPYCPTCRTRLAKRLEAHVLPHLRIHRRDTDERREQVRFVTGLCELVPVRSTNEPEDTTIRAVQQAVDGLREDFAAFKRKFKRVWRSAVVEFELVDVDALRAWSGCPKKRDTIFAMLGLEAGSATGHYILVHFHGLFDAVGESHDEIQEWLNHRFAKRHHLQMDYKRTYVGQSLEELAWKTSSYVYKDRVQYNYDMKTDGFKGMPYFSNFLLNELVMLYHIIGGKEQKGLFLKSYSTSDHDD